jgi:hypothetical protein
MFLDITHYLKTLFCLFFKTQRFGDWILSPSSVKSAQLGPISRPSPYLRDPVSETLHFEK